MVDKHTERSQTVYPRQQTPQGPSVAPVEYPSRQYKHDIKDGVLRYALNTPSTSSQSNFGILLGYILHIGITIATANFCTNTRLQLYSNNEWS